jgi:hypothetical protein
MSEDDIEIDLSKTRHFEAGAIMLAMLALPHGSEETRGGLIFSLCSRALRARFDLTRPESHREHLLKPVYVFRTEAEMRKDFRTFDRRLRDRLVAADMAIALLKKATGALPIKLPAGLKSLSLNELSEWAGRKFPKIPKKGRDREPGNTETRIWRESLPVIHFAAALAIVSQALEREGRGKIHPVDILAQPPLIEWISEEAGRIAEVIEKERILGRKPAPLIRIRLLAA